MNKKYIIFIILLFLSFAILSLFVYIRSYSSNKYIYEVPNKYGRSLETALDNLSSALIDNTSLGYITNLLHSKHIGVIIYKRISLILVYNNSRILSNYPNESKAFKEAYIIASSVLGSGIVAKIGNRTQGEYNPHKQVAYATFVEASFRVPFRHAVIYKYKWPTTSRNIDICLGVPVLIIPIKISWSFPRTPLSDNIDIVMAVYNETGKLAYYDVLGIHIGTKSTNISIPFQLPRPDSCSASYTQKGSVYYGIRYLRDANGDGYTRLTLKIYVLVQKFDTKKGRLELKIPGVALFLPGRSR